jgi:AcrR family transcriptional regulator
MFTPYTGLEGSATVVAYTRPYHHGDLRSALLEAGLLLARTGGVAALGLRELTRSVGVTPNAAYRHFADRRSLVLAVAERAQDQLARTMLDRMAAIPADADPAERALARLRAVGQGYIHFALTEPGWFEVAFLTQDERRADDPAPTVEERAPAPYKLLLEALDEAVAAGILSPARRPDAEWSCWAAVHGFADLATRGPLRGRDRAGIEKLGAQVVDAIIDGVTNHAVTG